MFTDSNDQHAGFVIPGRAMKVLSLRVSESLLAETGVM
jgi:hypothetical protein